MTVKESESDRPMQKSTRRPTILTRHDGTGRAPVHRVESQVWELRVGQECLDLSPDGGASLSISLVSDGGTVHLFQFRV